MVSVGVLQDLRGHAQETGGFPDRHTALHSQVAAVWRNVCGVNLARQTGELYRRFTDEPLDGRESTEWGREDHVEDMLGEDFELDFEDGTLWIDAESGEELWEIFSVSSPPMLGLVRMLDEVKGEEFHQAFVELFESYREGDIVRARRRYLLTLGQRR